MQECFVPPRRASPTVTPATRDALSLAPGDEELLCARCGFAITRDDARLSIDGVHERTETNPDGCTFRFGCFATAPGCRPRGVPSKQATWFPGFWWYVQVCGACGEHLGWLFFGDAPETGDFFGLILDKLTGAASE
jgi:hypothetical protein